MHFDITVYCRSEKEAKRVHYLWFKRGYDPKRKEILINKKGYLIISSSLYVEVKEIKGWSFGRSTSFMFPVEKFWTTCGFYPLKIRRGFFNRKHYDKMVPNSLKFITNL